MGNTPSSDMPRKAPHKLSKPHTGGRNTAIGPVGPGSPRASNVQLAGSLNQAAHIASPTTASPSTGWPLAPTNELVVENHGSIPDHQTEGGYKRSSGLYRSRTFQSDQGERRGSLGLGVVHPGDLRNNSKTILPIGEDRPMPRAYSLQSHDIRAAATFDLRQSDIQRADVKQNDQHNMVASPTRQSFDTVAETPQPKSGAIPRNSSEVSLYIPMRRRSMIQTPGVATRAQAPLSNKSSFRRSHPPTPNMSRRSSKEHVASRHLSMPPPPTNPIYQERAVTPCEDEFRQLGGMKFGSLRIINASPVPSPTPDHGRTSSGPFAPPGEVSSRSYFEINDPTATLKPGTEGTEAALEMQQHQSGPQVPVFAPVAWKDGQPAITLLTSQAQADVPLKPQPSPQTHPRSPGLQVSSKHTALEDDLFEEDFSLPEFAVPEVLDLRDDPHAKPDAISDHSLPNSKNPSIVSRQDSACACTPSSEVSRLPLSKSDSGYASKSSLRSLHGSGSKHKDEQPEFRSSFETSLPEEKPSTVPPFSPVMKQKDAKPSPQPVLVGSVKPQIEPAVTSPKSLASTASLMRLPLLKSRESRESILSRSIKGAIPTRTKSVESKGGKANLEMTGLGKTTSAGASKASKLQRLLSGRRRKSLPAAHATFTDHGFDDSIPSVPIVMEQHLTERNGQFPTTTRRLALRVEPSKETLKTILSVGSLEMHQLEDEVELSDGVKIHHSEVYSQLLPNPSVRSLVKSRSDETISATHLAQSETVTPASGIATEEVRDQIVPVEKIEKTVSRPAESEHKPKNVACFAARFSGSATQLVPGQETGEYDLPPPRTRRTLTKPHRAGSRPHGLAVTHSEPEFLRIDPAPRSSLMPDIRSEKRSKTPPPLSMRASTSRMISAMKSDSEVNIVERTTPETSVVRGRSEERTRSLPYSRQSSSAGQTKATGHRFTQNDVRHESDARARHESSGHKSTRDRRSGRRQSDHQRPVANVEPTSSVPLQHTGGHDDFDRARGRVPYHSSQEQYDQAMFRRRSQQQLPQQSHGPSSRPHQRDVRRSLDSRAGPLEQNPPFRVLHSYNSPAYKGVPIWG